MFTILSVRTLLAMVTTVLLVAVAAATEEELWEVGDVSAKSVLCWRCAKALNCSTKLGVDVVTAVVGMVVVRVLAATTATAGLVAMGGLLLVVEMEDEEDEVMSVFCGTSILMGVGWVVMGDTVLVRAAAPAAGGGWKTDGINTA